MSTTPGGGGKTEVTVSVVVAVLANLAEIVTAVEAPTLFVVMGKFAVVLPAATTTEAGTIATEGALDVSVTVVPPVGAGALKVTDPCAGLPPDKVDGVALTDVTPMMLTLTPPTGV